MNNTFSIESILFKDMYTNNNKSISSNTKITKSLDDCVYDAYKSSEDLKFYETYTMINDYNNTQKLRMLNKLRYATNNIKNKQAHNSCESYIRSIEEESNVDNGKKKNRFLQFFATIGRAILKAFKFIFGPIYRFFIQFSKKSKELAHKTFSQYKSEEKDKLIHDEKVKSEIVNNIFKEYNGPDRIINIFNKSDISNIKYLPKYLKEFNSYINKDMKEILHDKYITSTSFDSYFGMHKKEFEKIDKLLNNDEMYISIENYKKILLSNDVFGQIMSEHSSIDERIDNIVYSFKRSSESLDDLREDFEDFQNDIKKKADTINFNDTSSDKFIKCVSDLTKMIHELSKKTLETYKNLQPAMSLISRLIKHIRDYIDDNAENKQNDDIKKYNIKEKDVVENRAKYEDKEWEKKERQRQRENEK